ncbi:MAG: hypothetical protein ABFS46_16470 [Myxococcota bacterium]
MTTSSGAMRPRRSGADRSELRARVWVLGVWLLCSVAGLAFVASHQRDVPHRHDFDLIEVQTGAEALGFQFLWQPVAGHRKPLPKLFHLGLLRATGGDLRVASFLSAFTLAGLSLAMLGGARRLRGYTRVSDAFFPLLLQSWGHHAAYLRGFHLHVIVSVALACVAWLAVMGRGWRLGAGRIALLGAVALTLPLLGAWGPFYALTPILILVGAAVVDLRENGPSERRRAGACLAVAALAAVGLGAYLYGLPQMLTFGEGGSFASALTGFVRFFGMSFGAAGQSSWLLPAALTLLVVTLSLVLLARSFARGPREAVVLALLGFFGSALLVAVAIALSRGPTSSMAGLAARYSTPAAAVLCAAYFTLELCTPPRAARVAQAAFFAGVLLLLPANLEAGLRAGRAQRAWSLAFERDALIGLGPGQLGVRHPKLHPGRTACYRAERLQLLMRSRAGIFRRVETLPPDDLEVACPDRGREAHQADPPGGSAP